jgi:hypothetical protein
LHDLRGQGLPAVGADDLEPDLPRPAEGRDHLHGATLRIQAHESVTQILLGVGVEGLERIRGRIGREIVVEAVPAYHPEQYQIVSEGPRVELLTPPEVDLRFDDAPEGIALEDDAKADELDVEPDGEANGEAMDEVAELADEPPADEEGAPAPDLRDV